jgi:hypothetical protein
MKRMICATMALFLLAAGADTYAQITITQSDVAAQLAVNATVQNRKDTSGNSLNIGTPGATSWNFSTLENHGVTALQSVTLATTPYAANFSAATHTLFSNVYVPDIGQSIPVYLYLGLTANCLQNFGTKGGPPPTQFVTILVQDLNSPVDTVYALPSTLGTTWRSRFTETQTATLNGGNLTTPVVVTHNAYYQVDAYGPMTMPGGATYDALRIRKMDSTSAGARLLYIFLAKNGASVQVGAGNSNAASSGTIAVSSVSWSQPFNTAVRAPEERPASFSLAQNYPNPFNPTTVINYTIADRQAASIRVYDILGREVATLLNEVKDPGSYTVSFDGARLASGLYYYRLTAGSFIATRKMLLMR